MKPTTNLQVEADLGRLAESNDKISEVESSALISVLERNEGTTTANAGESDSAVVELQGLLTGTLEELNGRIQPTTSIEVRRERISSRN